MFLRVFVCLWVTVSERLHVNVPVSSQKGVFINSCAVLYVNMGECAVMGENIWKCVYVCV